MLMSSLVKISRIISNYIADKISTLKMAKRHNSINMLVDCWFLHSADYPMVPYTVPSFLKVF